MAHLGGPSTRSSNLPEHTIYPPINLLIRPEDLALVTDIREPHKARWMQAIINLWHIIESSAPQSTAYNSAYAKLVRITDSVKLACEHQLTTFPATGLNGLATRNGHAQDVVNAGSENGAGYTSTFGESSTSNATGNHGHPMNVRDLNLPTTAFVNLSEIPDHWMNCDLCDNTYSTYELAGQGFTVYPVRMPGCGHIYCYDCARMYISHSQCPDCDTKLEDRSQALAYIDGQIENCRHFLIAIFNERLQRGLLRAPPGYPTLGPQPQEVADSVAADYDGEETVTEVAYGLGEGGDSDGGDLDSSASVAATELADYGTWTAINTYAKDDLDAAYTLLDMRYRHSTPSPYRT